MLTPRLRQRLDLDVGRVSTDRVEVVANHAKLLRVQVQRSLRPDGGQTLVVEPTDRDDRG